MRRTLAGSIAFLAMFGTILVLPVYAEPTPEAEPVTTAAEEIPLGSVAAPEEAAAVQEGTTDAVEGVPDEAPVLAVQELDVDFSLVGVTWAHDPAVVDTLVQVRARSAAGAWGEWTTVGVEDAEQNADSGQATRGGTSPLWTGPSTGVEVELVTRSGAAPADVQLDLVDPGESAADAHLETPDIQDTADAAIALPPVFSRAQWGADERIRTWAPQYAPTLKAATIHHTADSNAYTADDVPAIMRSIYRYHTVSRGWGDIGYNVIADKYGRLWEGRYGGLASTVIGAHAGGFNTGTFGVSMLGNYETAIPPQGMLDAVADIIAWKLSLYGVDPRGWTHLTSGGGGTSRYAAGEVVALPTVFAHRDVGSTACPGQHAFARMDDVRSRVAAQVDVGMTAIERRYYADADLRDALGGEVGAERYGGGYSWREYEYGRLYWSAASGVRVVWGDILTEFLAAGGPGVLGVPTTDEDWAGQWGAFNHFANGASIYWSEETGAQVVRGGIRDRWMRLGAEWGLGFPTGGEVPAAGVAGAWKQAFTGGEVYWSAATGAFELRGGIAAAWAAAGGASRFGLPISGEVAAGGAFTQEFSRGYTLVWTSGGTRLLSAEWIRQSWSPCPVKPEYGYLWWLNDQQVPWPGAPTTGRSARGNGGRHLLWVDPARDLVLASHWTEDPLELIRSVSAAVTVGEGRRPAPPTPRSRQHLTP